jgi:hypothetical protein
MSEAPDHCFPFVWHTGETTAARFPGVAPYCFIEDTNAASKALFHSFGFARVSEQSWHIFSTGSA